MTDAQVQAESPTRSDQPGRLVLSLWRLVDAAWLAALRFCFGLTMAIGLIRFVAYGWLELFLVQPTFHFKYWGFDWVQPLPGPALYGLVYALVALSACVAVGCFYRISAWAFVIGFGYLELLDVTTYLNHYYLAVLLGALLALSPAHRTWSVDAWLARRGRQWHAPAAMVPALWLYAMRFQVAVVYTFAGLAKAQSDWLVHAQPLRIWLGARTELPWIGPLLQTSWAAPALSWLGFFFDLSIAAWLLVPRTRPWAFLAVLAFHGLTGVLFPIGLFPVIMITSALVFFAPDWPRRVLGRAGQWLGKSLSRSASSRPPPVTLPPPWRRNATLFAAGLYGLVHLALPLRHLAYPGNVLWHEQGMRWSWRVMVREKNGTVNFTVRDPDTGQSWHVPPRRYLNRAQEREMSGQPDLILQLAHHIRDEFRARGHARVEVRADALVSLNARSMQRLIDPEIDLAQVDDGLATAAWISPMPSEVPRRLRPL